MTIFIPLKKIKISQHYLTAALPSDFFAYQFKVSLAFKAHQLQSLPAFPVATQPNVHACAFPHDADWHRWQQQPRIHSVLKTQDLA